MDPTISVCQSQYSFNKNAITNVQYPQPLPPPSGEASLKLALIPSVAYPSDVYVRANDDITKLYQDVIALRDTSIQVRASKRAIYNYAEAKTNPFNLGRSIFTLSDGGIKMANIDAIFNVTGVMTSVSAAAPIPAGEVEGAGGVKFTFCALADGPGKFTKYIQYRRPKSYGFGMSQYSSKDEHGHNWNLAELSQGRFDVLPGGVNAIPAVPGVTIPESTGNLYTHYPDVIEHARGVGGVDLVIGNGGVGASELDSMRLILIEMLIAGYITKNGGNLVLRVFDIMTKPMLDLIYILICGYEYVYVFKPSSSKITSPERYIIAKGRRTNVPIHEILGVALKQIEAGGAFSSILDISPVGFTDIATKIFEYNQIHLHYQRVYMSNILTYADAVENGREGTAQIEALTRFGYDYDKFFIVWSIPSNLTIAGPIPPPRSHPKSSTVPPVSVEPVVSLQIKPIIPVVTGKTIFQIYNWYMKTTIDSITDRLEKRKASLKLQRLLTDIVLGKANTANYANIATITAAIEPWSHTRAGDFYEFVSGPYKRAYSAQTIDALVKRVNGDWAMMYDLVERYYPFQQVTLDPSFYDDPGAYDAFNTPITAQLNKYCSYYDEDIVFGSLGKFQSVFPQSGSWIIYPLINTDFSMDIVSSAVTSVTLPDVKVKMYMPKW